MRRHLYQVGLVRCEFSASDREVKEATLRAIELAGMSPSTFASKRRIVIKSNMVAQGQPRYRGRIFTLTEPGVLAGVVEWLRRANPTAEIAIVDNFTGDCPLEVAVAELDYERYLAGYDVDIIDGEKGAVVPFPVPGGGLMFSRYLLPEALAKADAVVSVAHMKSHMSAGATLSLKNLFGWPSIRVYGGPRRYLHAPVRLPRVLADLGLIFQPQLCVIDGLIAANRSEWGGDPLRMDCILAGDNTVATDATAARLMGFDPEGDYPQFPYLFDSNTLLLASQAGLGPVAAGEIQVVGEEMTPLVKRFHVEGRRSPQEVEAVRRDTCVQALLFREKREDFLAQYRGRYIGLVDGQVVFNEPSLIGLTSRGRMMTGHPHRAFFLKYVEEADTDPERYEVYEEILGRVE